MITVRELARSQGFPDSFVFEAIGQNVVTVGVTLHCSKYVILYLIDCQMHRQIGNAVPLPVAHALGRELRKVLYHKWKANLDEAIRIDDEDEDEPEEHHLGIADDGDETQDDPSDNDDSDRMDTD